MASFTSHFNKYFKEQLEPYGFVKLKGLNAYGRLVNGELLHYIILYSRSSLVRGKKAFTVVFGVYSIYSFSERQYTKYDLINWGNSLLTVAPKRNPERENVYKDGEELQNLLYEYLYSVNDENDMLAKAKDCFDCVREYVLPFLDKITDLKEYVEYAKEYRNYIMRSADTFPSNDSLLMIKVNDHDDMKDIFSRKRDEILRQADGGNPDLESYINNDLYDVYINQTAKARDRVYEDPDMYKKALDILETRKQTGIKKLAELGIKNRMFSSLQADI